MQTADLVEGRLYGYRQTPRAGAPMLKVRLVEKVGRKGHVKVRYAEELHPVSSNTYELANLLFPGVNARRFSATKSEWHGSSAR
jgi:hypothetical protein